MNSDGRLISAHNLNGNQASISWRIADGAGFIYNQYKIFGG
jgi:hypothetical protein